jgi:hypothetical protein
MWQIQRLPLTTEGAGVRMQREAQLFLASGTRKLRDTSLVEAGHKAS